MVLTRRRRRSLGMSLSQIRALQRPQASYRPSDRCKRNRLPDGDPKTVAVTTYRRRKPKKD